MLPSKTFTWSTLEYLDSDNNERRRLRGKTFKMQTWEDLLTKLVKFS